MMMMNMNRAHDKKVKDNMDEYTYIIVTAQP